MNLKLLINKSEEEERKEMEGLYKSSIRFRKEVIDILEKDIEQLKTKLVRLRPSFLLHHKFHKITSEIKAKEDLINLIK